MIIELFLNLLLGLMKLLFSGVEFPPTPPETKAALEGFIDALDYAETLLPLFLPINLKPYVVLAIGLFSASFLYRPIKWIINKIIEVIP